MQSKKYRLFCVLFYAIYFTVVTAQSVVEYVSSANSGRPDYTEHDLYSDGIRVENTSYIFFRLKSAGNAYVLLQHDRNIYDSNAVEIKLGITNSHGISISTISSNPPWHSKWCPKPNIVSDQIYRTFRISWNKENIQVGRRNASHIDEVICSARIDFNVTYISIGTANNTIGYWTFFKEHIPTIEPPSLSTVPFTTDTTNTTVYEENNQKSETVPITDTTTSPLSTKLLVIETTNSTVSDSTSQHEKEETLYGQNVFMEAENDDLTALYVSVPVIITLAVLIIVTTFVLRSRKQKTHKPRRVVSLRFSRQKSKRTNLSVLTGIKNPAYDDSENDENCITNV